MSTFEERKAAALQAARDHQLKQTRAALERELVEQQLAEEQANEQLGAPPDPRRILAKTLTQIERHVDEISKKTNGELGMQDASALDKYASAALKIVQAEVALEKKKKAKLDSLTQAELDEMVAAKLKGHK